MKANIKYLLVAILTLAFSKGYSQVGAGVAGEVTTTSVKIKDIPNSFVNTVQGDNITGYGVGIYLKAGIGPIYIKPKAMFTYQSGITQVVYNDENSSSVSLVVTKLDFPVLV